MFPILFGSHQQFKNYLRCISRIEVGDKVECLIHRGSFIRPERLPTTWRYGDFWASTIILPIIGKARYQNHFDDELYSMTVVGIPRHDSEVTCGYEQEDNYSHSYGIPKEYGELDIYTNSDLDIIYTKIIKRKNNALKEMYSQ